MDLSWVAKGFAMIPAYTTDRTNTLGLLYIRAYRLHTIRHCSRENEDCLSDCCVLDMVTIE